MPLPAWIAVKQKVTESISLILNINNMTDTEEGTSIYNAVYDRTMFNESEKYGLTVDFGVIAEF
jgi:hypothetical protein